MDITELYQELIIDHGTHPRNFRTIDKASCCTEGFNPLCGDKITLYLNLEHGKIIDVSFQGSGCAISMASASLMTEVLMGKTFEEASQLFTAFQTLLTQEEGVTLELGKLMAFMGVKRFPSRVKCATLAWHTLQAALKQETKIEVLA